MTAGDIAVFIASSDNTQDVLQQVFPSIAKFWPDCPFPIYVGKNSGAMLPQGCHGIYAARSDWRSELLEQLGSLSVSRVILILDDFLFTRRVDSAALAKVVWEAVRKDYAYVRLKPVESALLPGLARRVRRLFQRNLIERIPTSMPYYAALQPALWKLTHLRACVEASHDIWSLEHVVDPRTPHFAVTTPVIRCTHVVERGRWLPAARKLFEESGLPFEAGERESWPTRTRWRIWLGIAKFAVFGYTGVRIRRIGSKLGVETAVARKELGRM